MHSAAAISAPKGIYTGYSYHITGAVTGVADGGVGALSAFGKHFDNLNGVSLRYAVKCTPITIGLNGTEFLTISLVNGANSLSAVSTSYQMLAANAEDHIVVEWDTNAAAGAKRLKAYVNGAEIALTITDASPAFTLAYSTLAPNVCYQSPLAIREFMLWLNTIPSFPAALSQLRTAANAPADVGERGQYLAVRPDVYLSLRGAAAAKAFASNRGKSAGTWSFASGIAYPNRTRIMGYGDSNGSGNGQATPYMSKLGDLFTIKLAFANHCVAGATLGAIASYIRNGGIQGRPSMAYVKANWPDAIFVLEGGGNSLPTDGTGGVTVATLTALWHDIVLAVTESLPDARFIVQGISSRVTSEVGTYKYDMLHGVNANLAATYGARYFDVDDYLRSDQAFTDAGYTKTAQDIADQANQIIPTAFRADVTHLNQKAHDLLLPRAFALMQSLGYV
ncbi:SGNH/GDSL hydrolase family protein [Rhodoferax sp. BLA1]|uniref:SGNH/GDSL hydrolase family protein n=1 Tax=Rhodoferax sp. BLA1 TaxID=2576062 RepID=UPI0015D38B6F|nr:SGNH/GDSL hydrolase family protein [Rhodoferax sp. BLA1]